MLLGRKIEIILFTIICLFPLILIGCSSDADSNWKEVNLTESDQEIVIDWENVNALLNERGNYSTESVNEAEMIVGYPIKTFKKVPHELEYTGIWISDVGLRLNNPPLTAAQLWVCENDKNSIVSLYLYNYEEFPEYEEEVEERITEQVEDKKWQVETVEVGETQVKKITGEMEFIPGEAPGIRLEWCDGDVKYSLSGEITDRFNEKTYLQLAQQLILQ